MKKIIIIILLLTLNNNIIGQKTSVNTTAMPFLLINSDARSGGMGDIGVTTTSDAFSIHHNPSKIAFNESKISIGLNYTPWLRNLTNDIFVGGGSYINKLNDKSAFGAEIKYFSLGKINLTSPTGNIIGSENPNEFAITGVYSMKLNKNYSMGIGLKYINSNYKIYNYDPNLNSVNTFAVDISGYYQSEEKDFKNFKGKYRFGFNIANIGPKVEYNPGIRNFIPTNAKIGGGFDFILDNINSLSINTELTKLLVPSNQSSKKKWFSGMFSSFADEDFNGELKEITWSLGAEYTYNNFLAIRTGYFHESELNGTRQYFTTGAGFKKKSFSINLSYLINTSKYRNPIENTLRFSLSFDLKK